MKALTVKELKSFADLNRIQELVISNQTKISKGLPKGLKVDLHDIYQRMSEELSEANSELEVLGKTQDSISKNLENLTELLDKNKILKNKIEKTQEMVDAFTQHYHENSNGGFHFPEVHNNVIIFISWVSSYLMRGRAEDLTIAEEIAKDYMAKSNPDESDYVIIKNWFETLSRINQDQSLQGKYLAWIKALKARKSSDSHQSIFELNQEEGKKINPLNLP